MICIKKNDRCLSLGKLRIRAWIGALAYFTAFIINDVDRTVIVCGAR